MAELNDKTDDETIGQYSNQSALTLLPTHHVHCAITENLTKACVVKDERIAMLEARLNEKEQHTLELQQACWTDSCPLIQLYIHAYVHTYKSC